MPGVDLPPSDTESRHLARTENIERKPRPEIVDDWTVVSGEITLTTSGSAGNVATVSFAPVRFKTKPLFTDGIEGPLLNSLITLTSWDTVVLDGTTYYIGATFAVFNAVAGSCNFVWVMQGRPR